MVEAKLLRKKLKNGLIVDKWDLVTIIEKQQAEIERLIMLCDCMTTESNRKGNEIEALKQIIDANNLNQNIGQFVKPTNEPVAWRCKKFYETQEGWFYNENEIGEPLYTHPIKEQYKFGVDWSKDGNAVTVLKICEDGVAEVVFMDYQEATHPVKEHFEDEPQAEELHEILQSNTELTETDLILILEVLIDSYDDTNRGFLEYKAMYKNSPMRKARIDGMKRMVDKHTHAIEIVEAILRKASEK